ncbi:MAG: hypothetical protein JW850_20130 [Thermoflexales bacterium]|nr:hypothetical protein [Thermoflexales bacterium]
MEHELGIDVWQYVDALVRRWKIIVLAALIAAGAAGLYGLAFPPGYKAVAGVALIKVKTDVEFDARFKTVSEDLLSSAGYARAMGGDDARRSALVGLVQNGAIANQVIRELGDQLSIGERKPANLMRKVNAQTLQKGDLIQIEVTDADPEKAALIANAWARAYERFVNNLYSGVPLDQSSSIQAEWEQAQQEYDQKQTALETFIAQSKVDELQRSIEGKSQVLDILQAGKQLALSTVVTQEINASTQIVTKYMDAQAANILLAFQKEQEAKRKILSAYIDSEVNSRLAAFNRDRDARAELFASYVQAEISGTLAVVDQQALDKTQRLSDYYAARLRIEHLLADAGAMRAQLIQGGDAVASSNTLAMLLLKSQAFSSSDDLPANLQVQLDGQPTSTAAQQLVDLDSLITALGQRRQDLDGDIRRLSEALSTGTGYDFLQDVTTPLTVTMAATDSLPARIEAYYEKLFEIGGLSQAAQQTAGGTPLFAEIEQLYPKLFTLGQLTQLAQVVPSDNPLALAADQRAKELAQLVSAESLPAYAAATESLGEASGTLHQEIRQMEAEMEQQKATRKRLTQERDLAWDTYTTLARKRSEVSIATSVTGSEVRFAAPAVTPTTRLASRAMGVATAALLGALLGVLLVFGIDYLAGSTGLQVGWGNPNAFWNRIPSWLLASGPGLPVGGRERRRAEQTGREPAESEET